MIYDEGRKREQKLMRIRQTGTTSEHDTRQSVTEMIRRIREPEDEEPAKQRVVAKPRPPSVVPPTEPETPIDRFHKSADQYSTVAKPHSITNDPVRLPGQFETVQEAVDNAEANIIPYFAGDERHVIEIHGGLYVEDVTISSDKIDLFGIGMPTIEGTLTLDVAVPSNFTGNYMSIEGIEFDGVATYAIDLPSFADVDAGPGAPWVELRFFNCWIHSEGTALRTLGRIKVFDSEIWVDPDGAYGNLTTPAIIIYLAGHTYWTEFDDCWIAGAVDDQIPAPPAGFPNTGMAWRNVGKLSTGVAPYVPYADSGVIFRHSTIRGWGYNECWRTVHDHCMCYGGHVPGALTGETYCYNSGDSSLLLRGQVYFDMTEVACRYLVEESDMTAGVAANTTDTYMRHFDHLSNGSSYLGALIVPGTNPITTGQAIQGTAYGKHSATWREFFVASGAPAEIGLLINCDTDIAHYINNLVAFGAGALQAIFPNPYRDG